MQMSQEKMLKTKLQVHYQQGKREAKGKTGPARVLREGERAVQVEGSTGKIQDHRGFLVTAATVPLLGAQGCIWVGRRLQTQSTAWWWTS